MYHLCGAINIQVTLPTTWRSSKNKHPRKVLNQLILRKFWRIQLVTQFIHSEYDGFSQDLDIANAILFPKINAPQRNFAHPQHPFKV